MSIIASKILENNTVINTKIRVLRSMNIAAVRFNMFKHGTIPDGTIQVDFKIGADIIGSCSLNSSEIANIPGTYFHGMVNFTMNDAFRVNLDTSVGYTELDVDISMTGHTNDVNNYIGLVKDSDLFGDQFGDPVTGDPAQDVWDNYFGFELYEYK